MEISLRQSSSTNILRRGLVVCIGVQGLVGHNVVFKKRFQILLTILAEQEAIEPGAKLLEGKVRGSK